MSESAELPPAARKFLSGGPGSPLLVTDASDASEVEPGRRDRVLVAAADRLSLRALSVPAGVRAPVVGVLLASGTSPVTLVPKPEWPVLQGIHARPAGDGWLTVLRFDRPVDVAAVVAEAGRQAVWADRAGNGGLWVGEVTAEQKVPPDVLLGAASGESEVSPVTGRTPVVVGAPAGPLALGPLDERVLNPIGFDAAVSGPAVPWSSLDLRDGVSEVLVSGLRAVPGVCVDWQSPEAARHVAALAMAGVPLLGGSVPPEAEVLLGARVRGPLEAAVDLSDEVAREEHSLVLRRAALDTFSTPAWRRAVAASIGVRVAAQPSVSVVLATRRADMLDFALRQVAKQVRPETGVEALELVLAPHGFEPDEARVRDLLPASVALQVVLQPASRVFGDVLGAAAEAAAGDVVLKMDDDDWYAADVVADLLRARTYSGAELVGMPPELHYVAERDLTLKRGHPSELYSRVVAGGTMLVDRQLLREVGGFRSVRKWVDAQLIAAVLAAGGAVYRTHGLGYVLRRNPTGHTWDIELDELLDPARVRASWPGFHPSRLLTYDDAERP